MSKLRVKVGARDTAGVQASIWRRQLTRHLSISSRPHSPTRPAFAMHEIRGPERFPPAPTSPGLAVDARTGWKGSLRGQVPAVTSPVSLRVAPDLARSPHGQHCSEQIVSRGHEGDLLPGRILTTDPLVERAKVRRPTNPLPGRFDDQVPHDRWPFACDVSQPVRLRRATSDRPACAWPTVVSRYSRSSSVIFFGL